MNTTASRRCLALLALLLIAQSASAAVIVKFDDFTVSSNPVVPVTGFFDVYFDISGGPGPAVAAYNLQLDVVPAASGLSFTGASEALGPMHPAIFPGQSPGVFGTGDTLLAADDLLPAVTVANGDGMLRVNYSIAPGTNGVFSPVFDPLFTLLFDGLGDPVTIDGFDPGTITINNVVPEPSTLVIWAMLGALGLGYRRWRSAKAASAVAKW